MAVDLGGWGWAVGMAIDLGAPVLGTAFGVPGLAGQAGQLLKRALGLSPNVSEATVKNAIDADPDAAKAAFQSADSAAAAKWDYLKRVVEVAGEVAKTNITEINKTIQAENKSKVPWWHWRHQLGYVVLLYALQQIFLVFWCAFGFMAADQLAMLFNATTILTGGLLGLLGFVAADNTSREQTAMTGKVPEGVIASTVRAITGKKK